VARVARLVLIALAVIGGLYVVLTVAVSFGCTSEQTALVPSPDERYVATVSLSRCGREDPAKLSVWLSTRWQPNVADSVFIASKRGAGDDGADPRVHIAWTADNALEVAYPYYLEVTSKTSNVGEVAVSFRRTENP
jgi:hypothetical protein